MPALGFAPPGSDGLTETEALELWALAMVCESVQGTESREVEAQAFMRIVAFVRGMKLEAFRNRPMQVVTDEKDPEIMDQINAIVQGLPGRTI
jgi:hypothetical protein